MAPRDTVSPDVKGTSESFDNRCLKDRMHRLAGGHLPPQPRLADHDCYPASQTLLQALTYLMVRSPLCVQCTNGWYSDPVRMPRTPSPRRYAAGLIVAVVISPYGGSFGN